MEYRKTFGLSAIEMLEEPVEEVRFFDLYQQLMKQRSDMNEARENREAERRKS